MTCVNEYFLPSDSCTIPIEIIWGAIIAFVFGLLMIMVVGISTEIRHFTVLIYLFTNIYISMPISVFVRLVPLFFIITAAWERILLIFGLITCFGLMFLDLDAFIAVQLAIKVLVIVYYFKTHKSVITKSKQF